jgi:hypothetical protein
MHADLSAASSSVVRDAAANFAARISTSPR